VPPYLLSIIVPLQSNIWWGGFIHPEPLPIGSVEHEIVQPFFGFHEYAYTST